MKPALLFGALMLAACNGAAPSLIEPEGIVGDAIPEPLTELSADAARGERVFAERDQGHCVLCHVVSGLDAPFQGNIGPDLSQVGARLSAGQLRLRIVDYQIVSPGALMPSYFRNHDLYQVQNDYLGETILSAQQVEDLVAYLSALEGDVDETG